MKILKCKCGKNILVDDKNYEFLKKYTWSCSISQVRTMMTTSSGPQSFSIVSFILDTPSGLEPDHIDRDIHNNQEANIRFGTRSQNMANTIKHNSTGFIGVSRNGNGFRGEVRKEGKRFTTRTYKNSEEAAHARDALAKREFGEFAVLNFPI